MLGFLADNVRPASGEPVGPMARDSREAVLRATIEATLRRHAGNIRRTAAALGISRNTLRARMDRYGLRHPDTVRGTDRPEALRARAAVAPALWERRQLAFLQARVEASTPLQTTRGLELIADKVGSFGGRLEETGPGDVVAVFGLEPADNAPSLAALAALAIQTTAANATVTGTLSYPEPIPLTPEAVAIVTIIDQTSAPEAGAIAGQQRIDAPTQVPIDFSVVVDTATLDPTHAYALFATITDGLNTWQNPVGQPVITGGPSKGIELTLAPVPASGPASIPGTIAVPAGTVLSPAAVSIAALIKVETGTLVSRQVQPIADPAALAFNVAFDPSLTDPAATYVVKAAIVDGGAVWQNREGVAAIQGGVPVSAVEVPVTPAGTTLPGFSPAPSGAPSTSTGPSAVTG
jgi:uncharacterized lipoprotein YbaY